MQIVANLVFRELFRIFVPMYKYKKRKLKQKRRRREKVVKKSTALSVDEKIELHKLRLLKKSEGLDEQQAKRLLFLANRFWDNTKVGLPTILKIYNK